MNNFHHKDIVFRFSTGQGKGGQHQNKTNSCVTATHEPTGLQVKISGRCQHANKKKAIKELSKLFKAELEAKTAAHKKKDRDYKIKNSKYVRTYNYKKQQVTDHRSRKKAELNQFLRGNVDLRDFSEED